MESLPNEAAFRKVSGIPRKPTGSESGATDLNLIRVAFRVWRDLEMSLFRTMDIFQASNWVFLYSKLKLRTSNLLSHPQGAVESQVRVNWAHRTRVLEAKLPRQPWFCLNLVV